MRIKGKNVVTIGDVRIYCRICEGKNLKWKVHEKREKKERDSSTIKIKMAPFTIQRYIE